MTPLEIRPQIFLNMISDKFYHANQAINMLYDSFQSVLSLVNSDFIVSN